MANGAGRGALGGPCHPQCAGAAVVLSLPIPLLDGVYRCGADGGAHFVEVG
jgi:hypothetical protein